MIFFRHYRSIICGWIVLWGILCSCASVGKITNQDDSECLKNFQTQLALVMTEEGEPQLSAQRIASKIVAGLSFHPLGRRIFLVEGEDTDYSFFIQNNNGQCVLRLVRTRKGFTTYTNNLTYINSKDIPICRCED